MKKLSTLYTIPLFFLFVGYLIVDWKKVILLTTLCIIIEIVYKRISKKEKSKNHIVYFSE